MARGGRIAGITIELNGDATKLNKALSSVDKNLAKTKSALRDIEKGLKLDPKNTELLAQKQKYLAEAISGTKERLETLKSVQKDSVSPEQWDALQREIIETEQDLQSLENQYKSLDTTSGKATKSLGDSIKDAGGKISAAGDKIKSIGDGVSNMGRKLAPVSGAVAGIGIAAVKSFKEVDEGLDIIVKKTGATGDAFDDMGGMMKRIASEIPTSFAKAGEAIGEVNTRFGATGDTLEKTSKQFIQFAEINDSDVTQSVDTAQKALSAFGLSVDDVGGYLDVVSKTAQDTGVSVDTLMNGAIQNATAFQEMGLSIEQSTVFMGQMEKSGANSETVMQGLRKALKGATKEGKPLNQALAELQDTIEDDTTATGGLTAAYEIFGKSGDQIYGAVKNGTLDFKNLASASKDSGGTVAKTFEATLDPADKFETVLNQVKVVGAELAETVMPVLADVLVQVKDVIADLKTRWDGLTDGQKKAIVTIGALVAALSPVMMVLGPIISGVGSAIGLIGKVVTGVGGIVTAISGGGGLVATLGSLATAAAPFLVGGAIVAGIVAAVVLIVKNWDKMKAGAKKLWDGVKKAWSGIKDAVSDAMEKTKTVVSNGWKAVTTATSNAWNGIKNGVVSAWNGIKGAVSTGVSNAKQATTTGWNTIKTATTNAWTGIKTAVSNSWTNIKSAISTGVSNAKQATTTGWNTVKTATATAWNGIKTTVSTGMGNVKNAVSTGMGNVENAASNAWSAVKNTTSNAFSAMKTTASTALQTIKSGFSSAFSGLKISNPFSSLISTAQNAMSRIKSIFSGSISFPKIKMPHFSITGRFSLNPPSVPRLSIRWHKKAYDNAMLFNSPTVLQTPNGLKGFGDGHGGEVVYGRDQLMRDIAQAKGGDITVNVYGTDGMSVNALADAVQQRLVTIQRQRERAFA